MTAAGYAGAHVFTQNPTPIFNVTNVMVSGSFRHSDSAYFAGAHVDIEDGEMSGDKAGDTLEEAVGETPAAPPLLLQLLPLLEMQKYGLMLLMELMTYTPIMY